MYSQGGSEYLAVSLEMIKGGYAEVYRRTPAAGFDSAPYWKAKEEGRAAQKRMWVEGDKYVVLKNGEAQKRRTGGRGEWD
jgi:endonuclease YncB( thermonuclease family)